MTNNKAALVESKIHRGMAMISIPNTEILQKRNVRFH